MPVSAVVRKVWPAELCLTPQECSHPTCWRARSLSASPCVYCRQPIGSPHVWVVDHRTTRMIALDVWYAGFAHMRCFNREEGHLRPAFPRKKRNRRNEPVYKISSMRQRNLIASLKDGRFPDPQPLSGFHPDTESYSTESASQPSALDSTDPDDYDRG